MVDSKESDLERERESVTSTAFIVPSSQSRRRDESRQQGRNQNK
jgi:hypothetical protein